MYKNSIIILAGGFGTRLQSELNGMPKAMADINGIPFIQILLLNLIRSGFRNFVFSLYYKSDIIIDFLEKNKKTIFNDSEFTYVVEKQPLGTGGAISYVLENVKISDEFIVTNSDTWIENGYHLLLENKGTVVGVIKAEDTSRYGKIEIDSENNIINFEEKNKNSISGYINSGLYKFNKKDFDEWNGNPYSLEKDFFPKLISKNKVSAILLKVKFIDIGIPADYKLFCNFIKSY